MSSGNTILSKYDIMKTIESNESTNACTDRLTDPIKLVVADMADVMEQSKNEPSTAFAHCISADLGDKRHMSGGVAVTFRNMVGRPTASDCLTKSLTFQNINNTTAVYGLITKQRFFEKPTVQDYTQAFCHLTEDFISRKLKKLICSPMGCIRDNISPHIFCRNIVQFHCKTGASVEIVVKDERSSRTLRNGLKHTEFTEALQRCIARELTQCHSTSPDKFQPDQWRDTLDVSMDSERRAVSVHGKESAELASTSTPCPATGLHLSPSESSTVLNLSGSPITGFTFRDRMLNVPYT